MFSKNYNRELFKLLLNRDDIDLNYQNETCTWKSIKKTAVELAASNNNTEMAYLLFLDFRLEMKPTYFYYGNTARGISRAKKSITRFTPDLKKVWLKCLPEGVIGKVVKFLYS